MNPRSSAYKVHYDLRPAKQTERRILLDILKIGSEVGLSVSQYQYLGFGGFKFYDFEMLFRHLGIRDMISVERDKTIFSRCQFNKPFSFIETHLAPLGDYLDTWKARKPVIAWLDYDCSIEKEVLDNLQVIGAKAPPGSFVFATIDSRLPDTWLQFKLARRASMLKDDFGAAALNPNRSDMQPANFPFYSERVLWSALVAALSPRRDAEFIPLTRLFYRDTALMITVGGFLAPRDIAKNFRKAYRRQFPYFAKCSSPYFLPSSNFTLRERHILDRITTSEKSEDSLRAKMKSIGITKSAVTDYERLVRFLPKYVESYL